MGVKNSVFRFCVEIDVGSVLGCEGSGCEFMSSHEYRAPRKCHKSIIIDQG
jgi:hypothetical protein